MALLLLTNGPTSRVQPRNGTDFTLQELQEFVGGYVDIVRLPQDQVLVVNDEGLRLDLPFNFQASIAANNHIVGDALLCKASEVK